MSGALVQRCKIGAAALVGTIVLAACSEKPPAPQAVETQVPEDLADHAAPENVVAGANGGTPLEERVATLGLLNKRNNLTHDIELSPGEARRVGDVVVRLESCERTAPWESPPETGAFVQVLIQERQGSGQSLAWRKVFSGWLFRNSPSLNVVEHPIYDVWVKDCAMNFPGEESDASAASNKEA